MSRVLLDESVPRQFGFELGGHHVRTVQFMEWSGFKNGELLTLAASKFDVFLTADQNLQYQQKYAHLDIGIIVFVARDDRIQTLLPLVPRVLETLLIIEAGSVVEICSSTD